MSLEKMTVVKLTSKEYAQKKLWLGNYDSEIFVGAEGSYQKLLLTNH
jgi:hypothetical protein